MFNKSYKLTLTKNYVSSWGVTQAVRELIQNALDSESPFRYEFTQQDDSFTLRLDSEFTTLPINTLLLGSTSKADAPDSIGSFGEGYKIALLVLTRLGYPVTIYNGKKRWKPTFRYCKQFEDELLTIDEDDNPRKSSGLSFHLEGLTQEDVEQIQESCLLMQDKIGEVHSTQFGDILLDRPGKLYVGNLFICETGMHFGYNVKPQYLTLERDRQTVSSWNLGCITRDMWYETKQYDRIAELIEKEIPDMEYAEYTSPELVKDACYRLFRKQNPGAVVARSQLELQEFVKNGMTIEKVVVVGSSFHSNVSGSTYYNTVATQVKILTPHEVLAAWFKKSKYEMQSKHVASFEELLKQAKKWRN